MLIPIQNQLDCEQWSDFYHLYDHIYLPFMQFETKYGDSIFIRNDFIPYFFRFFKFTSPVYIVNTQGDVSPEHFFNKEILLHILDSPFILGWGMDCCTIEHPKIIQGLFSYTSFGDDCDSDKKIRKWIKQNQERWTNREKLDDVFGYFNDESNQYEREEWTKMFPGKNHFHRDLSFEDYLEEMSKYKYVLCPLSNLPHRNVWHALIVGSIPIIRVPKETLPKYEKYPYICLPGKIKVSLGYNFEDVREFHSIFKENKLNTLNENSFMYNWGISKIQL